MDVGFPVCHLVDRYPGAVGQDRERGLTTLACVPVILIIYIFFLIGVQGSDCGVEVESGNPQLSKSKPWSQIKDLLR